ncbi:hypothetical protein [Sideroxydans sp. CL21]|uniref:hypothetical protein n=1 Tax=Sideroxydans sp. CL21 TaxID=2600596 RepID=UPI0024BCC7B1|nr:hypothetical protein [Sideroxydans sp. CL21]
MNAAEFFKWFTPIIVGLISAYVASSLALKKFKKEKVWDERRAAYKEVIESIEEIIHWSEQLRASHCCEPTIGREGDVDASLRNLAKYSATGALIFSESFHDILKDANGRIHRIMFQIDDESKPDLNSEKEMAEWRFVHASEMRKVLEECLPKLISVAKSEQP